MTHALYLDDSYLKEFDAKVEKVINQDGKVFAILTQTAFLWLQMHQFHIQPIQECKMGLP